MRNVRRERGSTLVAVVVVIVVLTVVGLGLTRRAVGELEASTAKRQYDQAVSCAEGAREMLLSQFRTYGVVLTALTLDTSSGDRRFASGHFDRFGLQTVTPVDRSNVGGGTDNAMDITNRTARIGLGGAYYRITVVCSDSRAADRQSEVEFLVRFGL